MSGPIEHFRVIIYHDLHFGPLDISISNSAVYMWIAIVLVAAVLRLMTIRPKLIPGIGQLLAEMLYLFVARQTLLNIHNEGNRFIPLMFTLFTFILGCNLVGLIPGAFTPTSQLAVTGTLAVGIFLFATGLRFQRHGLGFFHAFVPAGVPKIMLPLMIPIELISYLARPVHSGPASVCKYDGRAYGYWCTGCARAGCTMVYSMATAWIYHCADCTGDDYSLYSGIYFYSIIMRLY